MILGAAGAAALVSHMCVWLFLFCVSLLLRLLSKRKAKAASTSSPVDVSVLCFEYQNAMVAGLSLLLPTTPSFDDVKLTVVGLGSGALPMFLAHAFPTMAIQAVELDPAIVDVATTHFGFSTSDRCAVTVGDGLRVVADLDAGSQTVLVVDVDAKDISTGLSFPPRVRLFFFGAFWMCLPVPHRHMPLQEFVSEPFLSHAHAALASHGMLVVNIACRSKPLYAATTAAIRDVFPVVLDVDASDDAVNRVLFALKAPLVGEFSVKDAVKHAKQLSSVAAQWDGAVKAAQWMSKLRVVTGDEEVPGADVDADEAAADPSAGAAGAAGAGAGAAGAGAGRRRRKHKGRGKKH